MSLLTHAQVEKVGELRNTCVVKKTGIFQVSETEPTREVIVRTVLESGPATATDLAEKLNITPAGVRRHLDQLVAQGILTTRDEYQSIHSEVHRGRPSKVFVMTDLGREKFSQAYDDLAISALDYMEKNIGILSITGFARARATELATRIKNLIGKDKVSNQELSSALKELGFASTLHTHENGAELCQRHCPVAHVAAIYPQICEEETKIFSEVLGSHVQRLATIGQGDGVCTTFIPKISNSNFQNPNLSEKKVKAKS